MLYSLSRDQPGKSTVGAELPGKSETLLLIVCTTNSGKSLPGSALGLFLGQKETEKALKVYESIWPCLMSRKLI